MRVEVYATTSWHSHTGTCFIHPSLLIQSKQGMTNDETIACAFPPGTRKRPV